MEAGVTRDCLHPVILLILSQYLICFPKRLPGQESTASRQNERHGPCGVLRGYEPSRHQGDSMRLSLLGSILAACLLFAATASAQAKGPVWSDANVPLPGRVVDVSAGEFFFQAPDSIPAGLMTFRLRQIGDVLTNREKVFAENLAPASADNDPTRAFHMLWLVRLEQGKTAADLYNAEHKDQPSPWAKRIGGPASAMPPRSSNATLVLEPGNYALVCFVGSAREDRNRYHLLKGMFRSLTVVPSQTRGAKLPKPDVVARITGSGQIRLSRPVRRGRQVIRVVNETPKFHEFGIGRLNPGRSIAEAVSWKRTDGTSHPLESWGGLSDVPPGGTLTTTIAFESGTYLFRTSRQPDTSVAVTVSGN